MRAGEAAQLKAKTARNRTVFQSWGTWTRTKNKGTRNLRVANYTIPQSMFRAALRPAPTLYFTRT